MPDTTKQDSILTAIKEKAEEIKFGLLTIEFKVHEGVLTGGEVIDRREKLG